jgi:hypothetical protein
MASPSTLEADWPQQDRPADCVISQKRSSFLRVIAFEFPQGKFQRGFQFLKILFTLLTYLLHAAESFLKS